MSQRTPQHLRDPSVLTKSEIDLLGALTSAISVPDAARRLGISENTARRKVATICHKLGANGWREAVVRWSAA
jgi:DNA-binding NarL/FixJ family response regulator